MLNILSIFHFLFFFFFNDTATTEIYTLSLHDALPISFQESNPAFSAAAEPFLGGCADRKSTRLNSSHQLISYAVFCLKKKKNREIRGRMENKERDTQRVKDTNVET